jgi:hypothetical protein
MLLQSQASKLLLDRVQRLTKSANPIVRHALGDLPALLEAWILCTERRLIELEAGGLIEPGESGGASG